MAPRRTRLDREATPLARDAWLADEIDDAEAGADGRLGSIEDKIDRLATRSLLNLGGLAVASVLLVIDILVRTAGG